MHLSLVMDVHLKREDRLSPDVGGQGHCHASIRRRLEGTRETYSVNQTSECHTPGAGITCMSQTANPALPGEETTFQPNALPRGALFDANAQSLRFSPGKKLIAAERAEISLEM